MHRQEVRSNVQAPVISTDRLLFEPLNLKTIPAACLRQPSSLGRGSGRQTLEMAPNGAGRLPGCSHASDASVGAHGGN